MLSSVDVTDAILAKMCSHCPSVETCQNNGDYGDNESNGQLIACIYNNLQTVSYPSEPVVLSVPGEE